MNIDRLNILADALETGNLPPKFEFDMNMIFRPTPCGTAGCIAGLTLILFSDIRYSDACLAGELLGLNNNQYGPLFYPLDGGIYDRSDPKEAAAAVRNLIATDGETSW